MTVSPQGGGGCSGSNENQSRLERQLEWSRRIGINEMKRIYGASLFLRCTSYLFHLLALLAFCMAVAPILMPKISEADHYPIWTILCSGLLISMQFLKRLKMPSPCRKIITMLQIGLAIATGYFFFVQFIYIVLGAGIYYLWNNIFKPVLMFLSLYILLEASFYMLWNSRSRQARGFLIVLSLSFGIIGALLLHPIYAAILGMLMAVCFWIAVFSKVRHQLFRNDALSHKQLCAVLKQKKRDVSDDELVIPEDCKDISHKKFRQFFAWVSLVVQIIVAFWIIYEQNYEWILRRTANLGYTQAQFELGLRYANGSAVRQNFFEAVNWYRKAAEQGHKKAQFELGLFYAAGRGVRQNYAEAIKWYRKAAEQQNTALKKKYSSIAALELAEIYIILDEYDRAVACLDDIRLRQDQNAKICCLRSYLKACALLAKENNAEAEIRQFKQYVDFRDREKIAWDVSAFRFWLKRAKLSSFARQSIAELTDRFLWEIPYEYYYYGNLRWMRVSAELGDAGTYYTQYQIGVYYANGWGVMPDYAEAAKWYLKAIDKINASLKAMKVEYLPTRALKLAELYIALGDYDRAISYLDDSRLRQDQNAKILCLRAYLKVCALLAKGNDARAEIQQFYEYSPRLRSHCIDEGEALRAWMRKARLSDQARKIISEMTEVKR